MSHTPGESFQEVSFSTRKPEVGQVINIYVMSGDVRDDIVLVAPGTKSKHPSRGTGDRYAIVSRVAGDDYRVLMIEKFEEEDPTALQKKIDIFMGARAIPAPGMNWNVRILDNAVFGSAVNGFGDWKMPGPAWINAKPRIMKLRHADAVVGDLLPG
jgi:hypothetical protein